MLSGSSDHLFLDISTIDCRDTNISFSVQHLLNHEYYPHRPHPHPQKLQSQHSKDTPSRHPHKNKEPNTPKAPRKDHSKTQHRESRQPSKHRDGVDDRETYDSSQTVKIVHNKPSPKENAVKKSTKHSQPIPVAPSTPLSNKFQPAHPPRLRSKSNASLKANRRWSQAKQDFAGKAISSNISLTRKPSLEKMRSETNRGPTQQLKAKNEHIVRNDYFDEKAGKAQEKPKTTSGFKKIVTGVAAAKKSKKVVTTLGGSNSHWQKLNPKSPRLVKN